MQTDRGGRRARAHARTHGGRGGEEGLATAHIHNTMVVHNLKAGQRNDFACRLVSLDQMKSLLMLWGFYIQITVQS